MAIWLKPRFSYAPARVRGLKKGLKELKMTKKGKICPKSKIFGGILSTFFLVQALETYTMAIWPKPQFGFSRARVRGLKKGLKGLKMTKKRKICPKSKIILGILSTFFLVQALEKYAMAIWPEPQLSLAWAWVRGVKKCLKGFKMTKKRKICPKSRILGGILSKIFLVQAPGTYTMVIWPEPQLSFARAWVRGAQKGSKGAQND